MSETTAVTTRNPAASATDAGTQLAHERTDLAVERSYLASERTLMGWIRTALSMISFGFTLGKLGDVLQDVEVTGVFRGPRTVSIGGIAYFLVVVGTLALLGATVQHLLRAREYRRMGLGPHVSFAVPVAVLLVMAGGFAFSALVLKL